MSLPDNFTGGRVLSVVEFLLSFVIISFIGIVLHFFPLLNKLGEVLERKD